MKNRTLKTLLDFVNRSCQTI